MTMALFSLAKPLFGLVVGVAFVSMPVAREAAIHAHELDQQQMEALQELEREAAAREARQNPHPDEPPAPDVAPEGEDEQADPAEVQ